MANSKKADPEVEVIDNNGKNSWRHRSKFKNTQKVVIQKNSGGGGHALYLLGFIGSLIYWFQAAVGIGAFFTAILKSIVWPAYIVYKFLESFYGIV